MSTTATTRRATAPESPCPFDQRRADFARQAAIAAFGRKAIHALDEPGFKDRQPDHGPRPLGTIATKVTHDTGRKALHHWLAQAAQAESEKERKVALKIAGKIANLMGLDADLISRRAA